MAALFLSEAREHLSSIEALVLRLERTPDDGSILDATYRPFHTIKGNALAIGAIAVGRMAHGVESLLDEIRAGRRRLGPHDVDMILGAVDDLTGMFDRLARGLDGDALAEPHTPSPVDEHERPTETSSIKVETRRLDTLVDMAGELVVLHGMIRDGAAALDDNDPVVSRQIVKLGRLLSELQRISLSLRMVSLDGTFRRISRAVRDVSRTCGKPIDLIISGETTELDRHVIEQIADPLLHLVRNAIDHGIEDEAARASLGKPARAQLALRASHQEGQVVIEVSDDGCGLDPEKIRAHAVARSFVGEHDALSSGELQALIFKPGFSTAGAVTDMSGRGVGLDVVRQNVEALGGRIEIRTAPGRGTTFRLKLPLTLAIVRGVLISDGDERFVLPAATLREAFHVADCEVHAGPDGRRFATIRGQAMPLAGLGTLLGYGLRPGGRVVLTVAVDGRAAAISVDNVFGVQEFVVKALTTRERMRGISGGAVLGDGRVGLILDVAGLLALVEEASRLAA